MCGSMFLKKRKSQERTGVMQHITERVSFLFTLRTSKLRYLRTATSTLASYRSKAARSALKSSLVTWKAGGSNVSKKVTLFYLITMKTLNQTHSKSLESRWKKSKTRHDCSGLRCRNERVTFYTWSLISTSHTVSNWPASNKMRYQQGDSL